jgi:hypothetical protein
MNIDKSYIEQTQSYIEKNRDSMPEVVYKFINQVCQDEKKYLDLVKQWSEQKGVLKVPEAKAIKY